VSDIAHGGGRVALVTGGASGIGEAIVERLARAGHRVAIADLADAQQTADAVCSHGGDCISVRCDISSADAVGAAREEVEARLGPVEIVVANAGIYPTGPFDEYDFETWRRVFAVNLDSLFHLLKTFLPPMREARWGRVIAIATNLVYDGWPQSAAYVASKMGVVGMVRALTNDLGPDGITINAVAPGLVATPGNQAPGRDVAIFDRVLALQGIPERGRPEFIAGLVNFLATDEAEWITGQTIPVDGGVAHA
jgi:NAD(P)-dependent dehydrogenase (short-subunit alcohol dehydrogenase family)